MPQRQGKALAIEQRQFSAEWIGRQLGLAERRRVTVLTCGIAGGRKAGSGHDPYARVTYEREIRQAVKERGGHVVWQSGVELTACWGLPRAGEDHVRLAVGAALRIAELSRPDMPIGCAVETGLIVAGPNAAERGSLELAGRVYQGSRELLGKTEPGWVVVSDAFRLLAERSFDLAPLPRTPLPRCWRVICPRSCVDHRDHRHGPDPSFVGHIAERQMLDQVWLRIVDGQPQCVSISGEAGIGKSRLLRYLKQKVRAARARWIGFDCLPETRRAPLHAVRQGLRGQMADPAAGLKEFISDLGTPDRKLMQLLLEHCGEVIDGAFGVEGSRQERILALVLDWISAMATKGPVVLAFEDVHWADRGSLDFIAKVGDRLGELGQVCLIWTSRDPELRGFSTVVGHERLALARLSYEETQQLLACSEFGSGLPPATRQQIAVRSEGIPLFALELARLLANSNSEEEDRLDLILEPGPLNTVLSARLDALGGLKALAQSAAVIGRQFDAEVLALVLQMDRSRLIDDLHELVGLGILECIPRRKEPTLFRFAHTLLRDAAYASVVEGQRRELHRRTAEVLSQGRHAPEQGPEIVAGHYAVAGDCKGAFAWWFKAGLRAAEMSSTRAAVHHLSQALAARRQDPSAGSLQEEIEVLRLLGVQLASLKGNGAQEAVDAFQHCFDLSREVSGPEGDFDALWALHACFLVRGEIGRALQIGERLTASADRDGTEERRLRAHRMQGLAKLLSGQLGESFAHYRLVLDLYDEARHAVFRFRHASDQGALARAHLAWGEAIAGRLDSSARNADAALALSSRLRHPHTSAHVLCVLAARAQTLGEQQTASALAFAGRTIAERHEFPYWLAWADIILGWSQGAEGADGQDAAGIGQIEKAIRAYRRTGAAQALPYALLLVAEAALASNRPRRALSAAAEGWQLAWQHGLMLYASELLRVRAVAELRLGSDPAQVAQLAAQAERLAIQQGANTFSSRLAGFRIHPTA